MAERPYIPDVDIFVVHTKLEEHLARLIVGALIDHGYSVGVSMPREHTPAVEARATSASARAVLVIWPIEEDSVDLLEMEARTAAQRNALVEIYAGRMRPGVRYAGPVPIDFTGWDYKEPGTPWARLIKRLTPLCGAPRRRPIDKNELTQKAVLGATGMLTLAVIIGVVGQLTQQRPPTSNTAEAPDPILTAPQAPPIERVEEALVAPKRPDGIVLEGGPEAGYKRDLGDVDEGIDVDKLPPATAPPPPPTPEPVLIGPEQ
jgi:hypothetical protein